MNPTDAAALTSGTIPTIAFPEFAGTAQFFVAGIVQPGPYGTMGVFDAVNEVQTYQFIMPVKITVTRISFDVVVAPAGGQHLGIAIYDDTGGTQLITTGALTVGTGVSQITVASTVLTRGIYTMAWTHDDNLAVLRAISNQANWSALYNDRTVKIGRAANDGVGGACPATLGAITAKTGYSTIAVKLEK